MKTRLFLLIQAVSIISWAQTYASRSACDAAFTSSYPSSSVGSEANEKFCYGKYTLSTDEQKWVVCVEGKMEKAYGGTYSVNDNVGKIARANFKAECLKIANNQLAATAQIQAAQSAAQNASNPLSQSNLMNTVMQVAPVAVSAYQMMNKGSSNDKKSGSTSGSGSSTTSSPSGSSNNNSTAKNNNSSDNKNSTAQNTNADSSANASANKTDTTANTNSANGSNSTSKLETGNGSQPATQTISDNSSGSAVQVNSTSNTISSDQKNALHTNGNELSSEYSQLQVPVDKIQSAPTDVPDKVSPTSITSKDEAKTRELLNQYNQAASSIGNFPQNNIINYSNTNTQFTVEKTKISEYGNDLKKSCTSSAEKANLLCPEGNSPGSKAVKMLMDYGSPVLAAIGSAQKTCSTTQKFMNYAALGLAAAKAVCTGAKMLCDKNCATAVKRVEDLKVQLKNIEASANADYINSMMRCNTNYQGPNQGAALQGCISTNEAVKKKIDASLTQLSAALQKESAPTEGTSASRVVDCQNHTKDIALMAANIGSALLAANSAKKCSDQLSSNPTATTTTIADYCNDSANSTLQVCICQKDNTASGCPGYASSAETTIKPLSTSSGTTASTGGTTSSSGLTGSVGSGGSDSSSPYYSTNSGSGSGFSAANGLKTGSASDTASGKEGAADTSSGKSKWNLGGLSNYIDGLFGKTGSSSNDTSKLGIGSKDAEALKRQIASEQVRTEVSTASGKSNWEKVKQMYLIKNPTFVSGQ